METQDYLESLQDDLDRTVTALNLQQGTNFTDIATMAQNGGIMVGGNYVEQVSTMPTANSETVGKILQYVGTTTSQAPIYTNGYFYIGVTDGESTPTYSWQQIDVQPSGSGYEVTSNKVTSLSQSSTDTEYPSAKCVWDLLSNLGDFSLDDIHFITPSTMNSGENKIVDLWTLDEGIYLAKNYRSQWAFYVRNGGGTTTDNTTFLFMIYKNKVNNVQTSIDLAYIATMSNTGAIGFKKLYFNVTGGNYIAITDMTSVADMNPRFINSSAQTWKGEKTFNSLPKIASYVAPTDNTQFAPKKYVDDKPTTYSGYDATKTQILKNVNGVLTWVTEE